jgi:ADP-ribose pyrophosphatase
VAIVFTSRTFSVDVFRKRFPNGAEHEVTAVRHNPSIVIVPMADDGGVVLIRQFRPTVDRELWELPAGSLKDGEDAAAGARRECEEEIGLVPGRLERVRGLYAAPGFCDEELIFFIARDLAPPPANSTNRPDDDEYIEKKTVPVSEARAMVGRGEIVDLKTAYGLTLI